MKPILQLALALIYLFSTGLSQDGSPNLPDFNPSNPYNDEFEHHYDSPPPGEYSHEEGFEDEEYYRFELEEIETKYDMLYYNLLTQYSFDIPEDVLAEHEEAKQKEIEELNKEMEQRKRKREEKREKEEERQEERKQQREKLEKFVFGYLQEGQESRFGNEDIVLEGKEGQSEFDLSYEEVVLSVEDQQFFSQEADLYPVRMKDDDDDQFNYVPVMRVQKNAIRAIFDYCKENQQSQRCHAITYSNEQSNLESEIITFFANQFIDLFFVEKI